MFKLNAIVTLFLLSLVNANSNVRDFLRSTIKEVASVTTVANPQSTLPTSYVVTTYYTGSTNCINPSSVLYQALNYCYRQSSGSLYQMFTISSNVITNIQYLDSACTTVYGTPSTTSFYTTCTTVGIDSVVNSIVSTIPSTTTGYFGGIFYMDSACSIPVVGVVLPTGTCTESSIITCSGNIATQKDYGSSATCSGAIVAIYSTTLNQCNINSNGYYNEVFCPNSLSSSTSASTTCFAGSETVQLESGETKMLSEVLVGDRVLAADSYGNTKYSEVVAVPHPANQQAVTFTHLQTEAGRDLKLTAEHLLPVSESCSGSYSLVPASSVQEGSCVQTVTGAEKVSSVSEVQGQGVYSVVTKEEMVVVNGIVASPFARNHAAAHAWYNIVRVLYSVAPAMFQNNWVKNANLLFGNLAASF